MSDVGLTHIALPVTNMEASLTFYATYARMQVVHHRTDPDGTEVVWLSDRTRTFVIALIQSMLCVNTPGRPAVCAWGRPIQDIRSAIGLFCPTRMGTPLKSPMAKRSPLPSPRSQRETIRPDAPYRVSASHANLTGLGIATRLRPAARSRPRPACA